jgi:hypothetical protein
MTPAQKQWDTINQPDETPEKSPREKRAHLYRALYRLGFGPFSERNTAAVGARHEYVVAQAAMMQLIKKLEGTDL